MRRHGRTLRGAAGWWGLWPLVSVGGFVRCVWLGWSAVYLALRWLRRSDAVPVCWLRRKVAAWTRAAGGRAALAGGVVAGALFAAALLLGIERSNGVFLGWFGFVALAPLIALGSPVWEFDRVERPLSTLVDLVRVPSGRFRMGSPWWDWGKFSSERPRHRVDVASFYIGKFVVTRRLYREVAQSVAGVAIRQPWPKDREDDELPANELSWFDAVRFCNALSEREGLAASYVIGAGDQPAVELIEAAEGYRLPTEAEWEFACRAGTTARYSCGWFGRLADVAWNDGTVHAVGQKRSNGFGLHDMHGNVWEWCQDGWHANFHGAPADGSAWVGHGDITRVLRGGSSFFVTRFLRSAYRFRSEPSDRYVYIGFRVVRVRRRQR